MTAEQPVMIWPLIVYAAAVLGVVGIMLGLSYLLGQRHQENATGEVFESGILATGEARLRFSTHFYLVAILFVIFDLEVVFITAWAIAFHELGWTGYFAILVFIAILMIALFYELRVGGLDLAISGKKILINYKRLTKGKGIQ